MKMREQLLMNRVNIICNNYFQNAQSPKKSVINNFILQISTLWGRIDMAKLPKVTSHNVHFIACIFHYCFIFGVSETPNRSNATFQKSSMKNLFMITPRRGKVMKFWSYWKGTGGLKDPKLNMKEIKQPNNPSENCSTQNLPIMHKNKTFRYTQSDTKSLNSNI